MTLRDSDYRFLKGLDVARVFGELVKLNTNIYYHNTLDVIKWCEKITHEKR